MDVKENDIESKDEKINWIGLIINLVVMIVLGYFLYEWYNI